MPGEATGRPHFILGGQVLAMGECRLFNVLEHAQHRIVKVVYCDGTQVYRIRSVKEAPERDVGAAGLDGNPLCADDVDSRLVAISVDSAYCSPFITLRPCDSHDVSLLSPKKADPPSHRVTGAGRPYLLPT